MSPPGSPPPMVLVTGANSGLGAATVAELLRRGALVVATVRSDAAETSLRAAIADTVPADDRAEGRLIVDRLDLTDGDAARILIDRHRPDVVVNNAGQALLGAVRDVSDEDASDQLDALVIGPIRLARLASVHQEARGHGRIVNVSSVLADATIPFTGWYGGAKAALDTISDSLRLELAPVGIDVVTVQCGAVATDAWDHAGDEVRAGSDGATTSSRGRWADLTDLARPLFEHPATAGAVIAEAALADRPHPVYRVGFGSHLGMWSNLVPTRVTDLVAKVAMGLTQR